MDPQALRSLCDVVVAVSEYTLNVFPFDPGETWRREIDFCSRSKVVPGAFVLQRRQDFIGIRGFLQVANGSHAHGFNGSGNASETCEHQHLCGSVDPQKGLEHLQT